MAVLDTATTEGMMSEGMMSDREAARLHARSVKTRAISGVKVLTLRTAVSVGLRVLSSLCLARLLFPRDYGVFAVASTVTGLGLFLSDIGLGGALVRQAETPTEDETWTVFCSQQAITALVVLTVIFCAPVLLQAYGLSPSATHLLTTMAPGLFFFSLRVVPSMALEREMQFPAIARCELIENLVQTGSTIGLAALGCGPWALAGGGLLRGAVGLACIWNASPWRPRGAFRLQIALRLARFGLPFQLNALAPTMLGSWMPLAAGRILGVAAVGLTGWATNIASVPLMFSGVLYRVAFPAYSRLQSDPAALTQYLGASLRRLNALLCLLVPLFVIVCPVAIPALFSPRWTPAVPLVQWFSLEIVLLTLNGLMCAAQNATGYAADRLWVALGTGTLRAGAGWWAVVHFGLLGIGPAIFLASLVELGISTWAVGQRHPLCRALAPGVFRPLAATGLCLLLSEGGSRWVAHGDLRMQVGLALIVFLGLTALREMGSGRTTELRALARMLRSFPEAGPP